MNYLPSKALNDIALAFDNWLELVNTAAPNLLNKTEFGSFKRYDFPGHLKENLSVNEWQQVLRGIMRGEEMMIEKFIQTPPKLFVEIGCGLGTWVILAKLCGATCSIGVDIDPPRLAAAKKMLTLLPKEKNSGLEFRYGSILDMQFEAPVDVFYLKATIHHLLPLDDIFDYMFNNLSSGGRVIVHDPNGLHPISQISAFRDRGIELRGETINIETGKPIAFAKEDFFTFPGILHRFKRHGFKIEHRSGNLGFRSKGSDALYRKIIRPLGKNYLLATLFAPTYTVIAQKS